MAVENRGDVVLVEYRSCGRRVFGDARKPEDGITAEVLGA